MKKITVLFFCLISFLVNAQLIVKGIVMDELHEPLTFVNIIVTNSTHGVVTNNNGAFSITLNKKRATLEISYLGFITQKIKVNSRTSFLNIVLEEEANQLDEIVIVSKPKKRLRKKENPAYRILQEIWKRKKKDGLKLVAAYQYKKLLTTEIGLNNLDSIFLKELFKEQFKTVLEQLPYNENGVNYYIPLFIKETVSTVFGNNKISQERVNIEAEKTDGVQREGFIFDRMSNTFNAIDIHQNNIQIVRKSFVSPISTAGFETYDYVLHDSTMVDHKKQYNIHFFPRRGGDLAFTGDFWVADKHFSITKIKMNIDKDINLNFVRKLSIEKEYIIKDDSLYLPKKDTYTGDFTLTDKSEENKGLTIKKTSLFSNYVFDQPKEPLYYSQKVIRYKPNQFVKKELYWDSIRKSVKKNETYSLISNLKNKKKIRRIAGLLNTFGTGFVNITPSFQLGKYYNFLTKNSVEGTKLKLGFRTFKTIDDRFRLSGFLAYGTKDQKYKYGLEAKYLVSYKPRIAMAVAYLNDVEQLGAKLINTNGLNANVFDPNALFSRGDNFFLSSVNKTAIKFDIELRKNLHFGISFAHNTINSADRENFTIDYLDENKQRRSQVTNVTSDIYFAYTPGRFEYGFGVEQRMGKNLFPSLVINYKRGFKGVFNGTHHYDKIQFNYNYPILLGKLGLLNINLDGGKTFGTLPLSLLSPIPANQTFWVTKSTFSLMNYYDFVTDSYISGHFEQHFNGIILNKIPLLKRLKLRSLISFKTVYGTISDANRAINQSNIIYAAPDKKMYYEYGFGFENIGYKNIRPLRIDCVWRGDHTSVNGLPSPKFAIRVGLNIGAF